MNGDDHLTVWLHVPDGGRIGVARADGRATLVYPAGTIADRVEMREPAGVDGEHAFRVIDVRGTRIAEDGEYFHCLQPSAAEEPPLVGFEWRRGDDDAERRATDGIAELVRARLTGADDEARRSAAERFRRLNRCASCHDHDRPERTRVSEGGPRRATDRAGFYVVLGVLGDAAPLETHRPRDLNAGDPYVTVSCGASAARLDAGASGAATGAAYTCPDGRVPVARFDVARALAAGQRHAVEVCRSRRYLYEHMDGAARDAFAPAFEACALPR